MKTFKRWLVKEGRDIFGFEKRPKAESDPIQDEGLPLEPIRSDIVVENMLKNNLNGQEPFSNFPCHIQWGNEPGAIQMVITPLGSFKSIIRKLQTNLLGEVVWVCKQIIPYKDMAAASVVFDENFAEDIFKKIESINESQIEAPSKDYDKLENLTIKVCQFAQRKDILPEIFVFRDVRRIKQNENYLINFELRGQGVEAPGSARVEQFTIDMSYDKKTGMIRSFGHDVQSPLSGHQWYPQPSEWDEYFSPSQSDKEIAECIGAAFSTY